MVFCVGLTGNIASGKTAVAHIFKDFGVDVFSADSVAKDLTAAGMFPHQQIVARYGNDILYPNGEIARRKLREIIFSDEQERIWLEQLLHPLIREHLYRQIVSSKTPYALVEIPLLKDKSLYPYLSRILLVTASPESQISRVMARDHCSVEHARAILSTQPSLEQRLFLADDVVKNDSDWSELHVKISELHHHYLDLANKN